MFIDVFVMNRGRSEAWKRRVGVLSDNSGARVLTIGTDEFERHTFADSLMTCRTGRRERDGGGWSPRPLDELLPTVDVVGGAGERGVGHDVHGECSDVSRFHHAPDRQRLPELSTPCVKLISQTMTRRAGCRRSRAR